ncbi:MAG: hypothetical protein ABJA81_10800 [Nocardioidaceae bacterium]
MSSRPDQRSREEGSGVRRTGIEQEFAVRDRGSQVDFRRWTTSGAVPGRRLDRDDPNAYRQSWGGVITADGDEAEIATPPEPLEPEFTAALTASLGRLRGELRSVVGERTCHGVSTHLNVEVDNRTVVAAAQRFARRHSAAMMLLLDRADSPGLLVRPRHSRLEIGGEYATGPQLRAAMVFAAAAAVDCERASFAPPLGHPALEPARERFGWYVDRRAFGPDLYSEGRKARVGRCTAQDLLDWSWSRVRDRAEALMSPGEVGFVDAAVDGRHPLPCEDPDPDDVLAAGSPDGVALDLTADRILGPVTLSPLILTWDHAAFALTDGRTTRYVALPTEQADPWVESFSAGELTPWCLQLLATPAGDLGVLNGVEDVGRGRVFGGIRAAASLAHGERNPMTGLLSGAGSPPGSREHKHDAHQHDPSHHAKQTLAKHAVTRSRLWPVAAGGAATLAVVVGTFAVVHAKAGNKEETVPAAAAAATTAPETSATSPPVVKKDEEFVRSFAATYDVKVTVTDGNESQPVGTVTKRTVHLTADCSAPDKCVLALDGTAGSVRAEVLHIAGTFTEPCPDHSGRKVTDVYDMTLQPTGTGAVPSGLKGVVHLQSTNTEVCNDVKNDPVAFSWVGKRR